MKEILLTELQNVYFIVTIFSNKLTPLKLLCIILRIISLTSITFTTILLTFQHLNNATHTFPVLATNEFMRNVSPLL